MPFDATLLDVAALAWFLVVMLGYGRLIDRLAGSRPALNRQMAALRAHWMGRMLERDNRIMDSQLIGHTIHSVTFFASTTMLVVAALAGLLGGVDRVHEMVSELSFAARTSKQLFELKMLFLIGIFVYGFFKFTWALRQYNYLCALLGSAPLPPVPAPLAARTADATAEVMTHAVLAFNAGLRAYYFALAVLAWFVQPWLFLALTTWMLLVLLRRQTHSASFRAIEAQVDRLDAATAGIAGEERR